MRRLTLLVITFRALLFLVLVVGEVCSREIQSVEILCTYQKFSLLWCQVLIWVHASLRQDLNVLLEFLDLLQIVHEGLAYLLQQKRAVCNIETYSVFYLFELIIHLFHLSAFRLLKLLSLLLQRFGIVLQCWTKSYTLLKSVLDNKALQFLILLCFFFLKMFLHLLTIRFDYRVVLGGRAWLLGCLVSLDMCRRAAFL